eukprot:scaffold9455_cov54-Attheya_sp.AAC.1
MALKFGGDVPSSSSTAFNFEFGVPTVSTKKSRTAKPFKFADAKQELDGPLNGSLVPNSQTATTEPRSDTTDFENLTKRHIRPLIELNDRINALTSKETTINSTRIVVAGDQSHGKTSLLEALSGVDLPRGEGIQTRVPLVLQLRQAKTSYEFALIKIESSPQKPERISLEDISKKVREYTALAAGQGKEVLDAPIELKIFRRDQDDLTLVDLPGITRVAVKGQTGDVEALILGMCRRYMKPEESILLNVVSAMVDFSTSASLQLSRELDPQGKRTMLCITKIDQYQENGLHDKIKTGIEMMELDHDHVFAVRNRSQEENKNELPLDEVRRLEVLETEKILQMGDVPVCGLGVASLSKQLVKIQHDQILQTLPQIKLQVQKQIKDLNVKMKKLGRPVGDVTSCRTKAIHLIETCVIQLQNEIVGRADQTSTDQLNFCEGESFEISMVIKDLASLRKEKNSKVVDQSKTVGEFDFRLTIHPLGDDHEIKDDDQKHIASYLSFKPPLSVRVKRIEVDVNVSAVLENGRVVAQYSFSRDMSKDGCFGYGWTYFISAKEAKGIKGSMTFVASIFVEKLEIEYIEGKEANSKEYMLLCAQLNNLQDKMVSDVDLLHSNSHLFSGSFRKGLGREVAACRGGIGLPGVIAPHVSVNVLKRLRLKLPDTTNDFRQCVLEACVSKSIMIVNKHAEKKLYPKFHELMINECNRIFNSQCSILKSHHQLILGWEESVRSSNHYFMDTVQSIRASISSASEEKPSYLQHLTDAGIREMSNDEQRLVDMQIEIFAYWKLMKKRYVDYIIMSTYSELVNKPINETLKTSLMDAVFGRKDDELVKLFSPNDRIERERDNIISRLGRLCEARDALNDHDTTRTIG